MFKRKLQFKTIWSTIIMLAVLLAPLSSTGVVQAQGPYPIAPLLSPAKAEIVPGQYIVVYKDGIMAANAEHGIRAAVTANGGEVKFMYGAALNGYSAQLSPAALAAVRANPDVEYVEADAKIMLPEEAISSATTTQPGVSWGLDRIDQHDLPLSITYDYDKTGSGVNVYVIDTGIRSTHVDFGGRASKDYDSIGDGQAGNDCNGHGTHVAGTIGGTTYGVAKNVQLHAIRVLDCYGGGYYSQVIAGINWVTANHLSPAVANMSLGGDAYAPLDTAINHLINAGVVLAVAAGNSNGDACGFSPARVPNAITVGATDSTDARAYYSNTGSCVDIFAPGSYITSAWNSSNNDAYTLSGTSMASPHVAGVAALYLEDHPSATVAEVRNNIIGTASRNKVTTPGNGSPNRLLYSLLGPIPPISDPILPEGAIIDTTPTYKWSQVAGATQYSYDLIQAGVIVYTKTVASSVCVNTICVSTPGNILPYSTYKWRVKAFVSGVWETYSSYKSFTILKSAPAFTSPFTRNANGWSPIKGTWSVLKHSYYRTSGLYSYVATAAHTGKYFTLDYQVSLHRTGCTSCSNLLYVRGQPKPLDSYQGWNSGYLFEYTNNGYISVWAFVNGSYSVLQYWKTSSAIHKGGWNRLRVTANGNMLKFYVNGRLVWQGIDSSLTNGQVGLGLYKDGSGGNEFLVDWAMVRTTVANATPASETLAEVGEEMPNWNNPNMAAP